MPFDRETLTAQHLIQKASTKPIVSFHKMKPKYQAPTLKPHNIIHLLIGNKDNIQNLTTLYECKLSKRDCHTYDNS